MTARKSAGKKPAAKSAPEKRQSAKKAPAKKTGSTKSRPPETVVESTRAELERLGLFESALAASAMVLAKHVDGAQPGVATQAARELRMTLARLEGLPRASVSEEDDGDGATVVPPSRLEGLRRKSAQRGRAR